MTPVRDEMKTMLTLAGNSRAGLWGFTQAAIDAPGQLVAALSPAGMMYVGRNWASGVPRGGAAERAACRAKLI